MNTLHRRWVWLSVLTFLLPCVVVSSFASPLSELRGILRDQDGNPVVRLALSLVRAGMRQSTKSDHSGQFVFKDLPAGEYAVKLESSSFKPAGSSSVNLRAGEKVFLTVILEQVFAVDLIGPSSKNYQIRTILKDAGDGRLIFRNAPDVSTAQAGFPFRSNGILEVYSGLGLGYGSLARLPEGADPGMLTGFAYSEELNSRTSYVVAGQFVSGGGSLWKVRNAVRYERGATQDMEVSFGYTRLDCGPLPAAFRAQKDLRAGSEPAYSAGAARTISVGLKHQWSAAETISLGYGIDVDRFSAGPNSAPDIGQLRSASDIDLFATGTSRIFVSPSIEANWTPRAGSDVRARVTSKRVTSDNSFRLPDGRLVDVADSVEFSRIGDRLGIGINRRFEITSSQQLGPVRGEVSVFYDQLRGGSSYLALEPGRRELSLYTLPLQRTVQSGVRAGVTGGSDSMHYAVDYVYGSAAGLDGEVGLVNSVQEAVRRHNYHAITGRIQGTVPGTHTVVAGLIRFVPGKPLTTVDTFNDVWNISNQSVNFFLRQVIPFPDLLGFSPRLEALLDLRNLLNQDIGVVRTEVGDVVLIRNPRTVRGGLALNF
ncbi:MAG: carboxypeptidase regulatory-like domain-containing protein [Acidobacteria bacterium]|nr:carboxypeptidase regulatory-like domain-containing protein [Acidobacteriota bacterium]